MSRSFQCGKDGLSAGNVITEVHFDFGIQWQINIRARTELNKADALALEDFVSGLNIRDNSAGDDTCNQAQAKFHSRFRRIKPEQRILVAVGAFSANGIHKLAFCVFEENHLPGDGSVLNVNIQDGEEN